MSGFIRQINASDGSPITPPSTVKTSAAGLVVYANDAAYEAVHGAGQQGDKYFNSTELLEREHDGTGWVYVNKALTATTDAATTGTDNDLSATRFDLIRFTEGSLQSIRSIDPAQHKIIYMVNDQASQSITWVNEDGTATAANTIITGTGDDLIQEVDQVLVFIYDTESSRWRIAGGTGSGGGGLEIAIITNAESPVTGEIGKWYLTDTSAGPITVNMPDLSAIPSSKQASASMRFSDCKANWQVQPVTLVPFSGQSIDGAVADETMVLDVEAQHVWCARESASNWCFDTSIQPTLESGGGSGEGRVNLFSNSNFEDGTTGWSSTKPAQISLDTSTPLQGAQSLKITSDGAGQVVSTTLTVSADAYKGIQHGIEGVIDVPTTATTGDWVARFKRNGTTIANSEADLAPGRNRLQDLMAGFAPLLDTITFEIEDVSATASDEAICDIFVLTPQGQGNVTGVPTAWQSYTPTNTQGLGTITSRLEWRKNGSSIEIQGDFTTGTVTGDEGQLELPNSYTIDYQNSTGTVLLAEMARDASITSGYYYVIGTHGDTYVNFATNPAGTSSNALLPAAANVLFGSSTRNSFTKISIPVQELQYNAIQLLDNNGLYQNARARFYRNAAYSYTASTTFAFDTEDSTTYDPATGITNTAGVFSVDSDGTYDIVSGLSSTGGGWAADAIISLYVNRAGGGANIERRLGRNSSVNTTFFLYGSGSVKLQKGDTFEIRANFSASISANLVDTFIEIERRSDSTGAQATGAGTSALANENPQNVLVNYQKKDIDVTGSGNFLTGILKVRKHADGTVIISSDNTLTHSSSGSPISASGLIPTWARPSSSSKYNTYVQSGGVSYNALVQTDGTFQLQYRDSGGAASSRLDSLTSILLPYVI